jgi:hypothetical protein
MRVFIAAIMLASFAFALTVFGFMPPQAEAERGTVNVVVGPAPCPVAEASWCHEVGGLAVSSRELRQVRVRRTGSV